MTEKKFKMVADKKGWYLKMNKKPNHCAKTVL